MMEKMLMLGNEALARGLYEAGCSFVSSYPGTPSTEVTEAAARYPEIYAEWAPNEKVALESAFGASLAGVRSFCGMKHVGLNVAADPLFTMSYTGVNAGLLICVADDAGMHSSQNEQDSRNYAKAAKLPMLEPSDSEEALEFARLGYELSERFDTPVLIKMCTRVSHSQSVVTPGARETAPERPYHKQSEKYIMMPANAKRRHPVVEKRLRELSDWACTSPVNRWEVGSGNSLGVICSSTCYQYVREVCPEDVSVLKLGMVWPMPDELIREFAASVERLVVVEELDPFIEEHCRALGLEVEGKSLFPMEGEISQNLVAERLGYPVPRGVGHVDEIPARPPVMCAGCPHRGLFYTLAKQKLTVLSDIGCYTLGAVPPLGATDSVVCMGASVSGLHGFSKAGGKKAVAVIGDSTFMHSGITGLVNIAYNDSTGTVIILDNSITGMTGHQQNPTTGRNLKGEPAAKVDLEALCRAVGIKHVRVVDPYDLKQCDEVIREEVERGEASVIISRRPCVLLKYVKTKPPLHVNGEKCRSCRACMKLGCPAISMAGGKAEIDATLCTGCSLCAGLCAFGAFSGNGEG